MECIITTENRLSQQITNICEMDVEFTGQIGVEQKANARRIVACVNACAGIPTDHLADGCVAELALLASEKLNALTKQRDELLKAAKAVVNRWDSPQWKDQPHTGNYINALRQAVARCGSSEIEVKPFISTELRNPPEPVFVQDDNEGD